MIKGITGKKRKKSTKEELGRLLELELSEIEELSALLMSRIDERVKTLQNIERRLDEKIQLLEGLLSMTEKITQEADHSYNYRYREVMVLASKGLKVEEIASILDLPAGEVELIINMGE